jgi:hypothetical protein
LVPSFSVRYLHRWPLGTAYPDIVRDVCDLVRRPPLSWPILGCDATGVGRPIVDLFRAARVRARLRPVVIHGGEQVTAGEGGEARVPKRLLCSMLQAALQTRRLRIANVPERETLTNELLAFRVKVNVATGAESFEAWRERDHDDLVLAVALAVWLGSQAPSGPGLAGGIRPVYGASGQPLPPWTRGGRDLRAELARKLLGPAAGPVPGPLFPGPPWEGGP